MSTEGSRAINRFRNKVLSLLIIGFGGITALYTAGLSTKILTQGTGVLNDFFVNTFVDQLSIVTAELKGYWLYLWQYKTSVSISAYNYFMPKVVISTVIPLITYGAVIFKFRDRIAGIEVFKDEEMQYGDAHWAVEREVRKAGLREKRGFLLGKFNGKLLIIDRKDYQHVLLFAPTGSGKGVGFVIPNLLFWEDSVIVHDVKLENYELTSGYRGRKLDNKVFLWNPASPTGFSHCYNPLDWISKASGPMVDDVQKITNFLLAKDDFWYLEAKNLVLGVMLYLVADPNRPATFGEIVRILRSDDVAYNLAVVLDTMGNQIHPVGYMSLASFLQKADKERSGVCSTATSSLELWSNPLVDQMTSKSDFNLQTFRKEKTTVFVGVTPDNLARLKPLMQIFYQQATAFYTAKMPPKDEPYGVLMLMDEFPTLGKMEQFLSGIAYFRGYHVKLFLIVQDTEQLKSAYEDSGMNSFLSNSTYRITYSANNYDTAQLISNLLGNKTIESSSFSRPKYLDLNPQNRSLSISQAQRALLLPQEVIGLNRDDEIILIESKPPIRCKKIKYFEDKFFTRRLLKPTFVPHQEEYDPKKFFGNMMRKNDGGSLADVEKNKKG